MPARKYTTPRFPKENLLHRTFNHLTAIGYAGRNLKRSAQWLWRCDCGNLKVITAYNVKTGLTKSCGCWDSWRVKHGATVGGKDTPEYRSWEHMRHRCYSESNGGFKDYGGRGITVCDQWLGSNGFARFLADMGPRPSGTSIERKDVNGNYEISNCYWATPFQQSRNTRRTVHITFNGETLCMKDWAIRLGIDYDALRHRLKRMPVAAAFTLLLRRQSASPR